MRKQLSFKDLEQAAINRLSGLIESEDEKVALSAAKEILSKSKVTEEKDNGMLPDIMAALKEIKSE